MSRRMYFQSINYQRYLVSLLLLIIGLISNSNQQKLINSGQPRYSRLISDDYSGFVPIVQPPKMLEPISKYSNLNDNESSFSEETVPSTSSSSSSMIPANDENVINATASTKNDTTNEERGLTIRLRDVQNLLIELLKDEQNTDNGLVKRSTNDQQRAFITDILFNENFVNRVKKFTEKYIFQAASGSSLDNVIPSAGRVFFFKGLSVTLFIFFFLNFNLLLLLLLLLKY